MTDSASQVIVRGRNGSDWQAVMAICKALPPELSPLDMLYPSDDFASRTLSESPDNLATFGLVAELDNQVAGEITLRRDRPYGRTRHLGSIERLVVAPEKQGQGIDGKLLAAMIELAEGWLNLTRVQAVIPVDNEQAIALCGKFGFVNEGKLRDYTYRAGRYLDAYLMARIRDLP